MHFHHGYSGRGSWCIARFQLQFTQKFRHYFAITTAKQWQQGGKFPFLFFFLDPSHWIERQARVYGMPMQKDTMAFSVPTGIVYRAEKSKSSNVFTWAAISAAKFGVGHGTLAQLLERAKRQKRCNYENCCTFWKRPKLARFFGHSSSCPVGPIPSVRNCFWAK